MGACSLCCQLSFLALALGGFLELRRYTPLYEDIYCKPTSTAISGFQLSPLEAVVDIVITCTNPNPFDLLVVPASKGRLLAGERTGDDVGFVTVATSVIGADMTGDFVASATVKPSFLQMVTLAGVLLQGPFDIFFSLSCLS